MTDTNEGEKRAPKKLWSFIKSRRKDTSNVTALVNNQGNLVTDSKQKADMLSNQYKSVFTEEDHSNMPDMGPSPYDDLAPLHIGLQGVEKQLSKLNDKKATGPDLIPTRVLKEHSDLIAPVLQHLFQQSVDTGRVPADWKMANICAVFKKGDKTLCKNYRPVSLTCVICKTLEHIIASHIMKHLNRNSILAFFQHGFRSGHSCESQLINTIEELARNINNCEQVDAIILDFEKAFDTVAHTRLLNKLAHYGIRGPVHDWLRNWLTGRSQRVTLEGETSEEEHVKSGVPQGTVLGPILFLVYINNIADNTTSTIKLFADDALLFRKIKKEDDAATLQRDLDTIINWSHTWQMRFNPSKCSVLRISRKRKLITTDYKMSGITLQEVENHPYLGVELDSKLSWNKHIDKTCAKAHNTLNFLRRNMYNCPKPIKETAYKTLVRPIVEYCSSTWDPGSVGRIKQVEAVQRKAARFTTNTWDRQRSVTNLLQELNWRSLQERRLIRRLTLMYQAHHNLTAITIPPYIRPPTRPSTRSHPLQYMLLATRCNTYADSFWPRTLHTWNVLPAQCVQAETTESFKNQVIKSFIEDKLRMTTSRDYAARISSPVAARPTYTIVF
jgi:hypothetical protein